MVQFNFFRREVNCKIVYYGPGLSGKTTNLQIVHEKTPAVSRGDLTSIATEQDRTLFFDFMPIDLGTIGGMKTKLRLFTVPGQVFYNSTRKLVLQGADGIIFVADSQKHKMDENIESLKNLEENLKEYNMSIATMPLVIQWNKRDMPTALPVAELEAKLNRWRVPTFEAIACTGEGVFPTLKKCAALVLESVTKQANQATMSSGGTTSAMPPIVSKGPALPPTLAAKPGMTMPPKAPGVSPLGHAPGMTVPGMTAHGMTAPGMTAHGMTAHGITAPGMTVPTGVGGVPPLQAGLKEPAKPLFKKPMDNKK